MARVCVPDSDTQVCTRGAKHMQRQETLLPGVSLQVADLSHKFRVVVDRVIEENRV